MNAYLYTWNPKQSPWDDLNLKIDQVKNKGVSEGRWSCYDNRTKIKEGDIFFLMRLKTPPKGIIGFGVILTQPYTAKHWDESRADKTAYYTKIRFEALEEKPFLPLEYLKENYSNQQWTPQASGRSISHDIAEDLYELIQNDSRFMFKPGEKIINNHYQEGTTRISTITKYERNPAARQACIDHYGYQCSVCEFKFADIYGEKIGKDFIEVHHLKPVSTKQEEYEINPIEDLRPVCSNCHRMLHKRIPIYSIQELKEIIDEEKVESKQE